MPQHRSAGRPAPRRMRRVSGVLGVALVAAASFLGATAAHAQGAGDGLVRLGHLSPSTPAVDIYVTAPGMPPSRVPLVRDAGYGAVTPYQELAPGRYTVEMRSAGASPDTAAPLSSAVDVAPGSAQSLLFFDTGDGGAVQGRLLPDDRTPAAAGEGLVRIVQGAAVATPVEMQALGGPRLATALQYGTATDYHPVDARVWDLAIEAGDLRLDASLDVAEGSVSTVVLTQDMSGALVVTPLVDVSGTQAAGLPGAPVPAGSPVEVPGAGVPSAAVPPVGVPPTGAPDAVPGAAPMPQGGVPAGGGGTAPGADPLPVVMGLAGALLIVLAVSEVRLRRARHGV